MTRLLISAALAGLFALSAPTFAQNDHRDRGDRGDRNRPAQNAAPERPAPAQQQDRPQGQIGGRFGHGFNPGQAAQNQPSPGPDRRAREDRSPSAGAQNAPAAQPAPPQAMRAQGPNIDTRGPSTDRRAFGYNDRGGNDRGDNNFRGGYRGPDNNFRRGPDTAMRAPDNARREGGRNFAFFQRNFTAPHRFRAAEYRRPRGWYPHHWVFGEILPSLFWTQDYWLDDYMDFGLEPPPPGTVWVRDGYDALLIDRYSGEIIQVDYNVFF